MVQKSTLYNMGTPPSESHTLKVANGAGQKLRVNLYCVKFN